MALTKEMRNSHEFLPWFQILSFFFGNRWSSCSRSVLLLDALRLLMLFVEVFTYLEENLKCTL
jgi:hypothetical protein